MSCSITMGISGFRRRLRTHELMAVYMGHWLFRSLSKLQ